MALTKIPKTLLDTSAGVNLGDNEKLLIGASDDLQIYHDGNNSYITDTLVQLLLPQVVLILPHLLQRLSYNKNLLPLLVALQVHSMI